MYLQSKIEEVVALLVPERKPVYLLPSLPPLDETGKIILKAADLIRKHGWTRAEYFGHDGSLCALAALFVAITGRREKMTSSNHPAIVRVMSYIGGGFDIPTWNDAHGRTASEVIGMLEAAARYVR